MALIKCEECGKEISDKAAVCIHCGCPLNSSTSTENNTEDIYDVASIVDEYGNDRISACKELSHMYGLKLSEAKKLVDAEHNRRKKLSNSTPSTPIFLTKKSQQKYETKQRIKENKSNAVACCPKCGSTSLSANKKGFGLLKGAAGVATFGAYGVVTAGLGKNKVIVTCLNCGHQFKPGK